jgi:hypothetical protein
LWGRLSSLPFAAGRLESLPHVSGRFRLGLLFNTVQDTRSDGQRKPLRTYRSTIDNAFAGGHDSPWLHERLPYSQEALQLMPQETLARFTTLPGIKAIYRNYMRFPDTTAENAATEVNGVPVFRAVFDGGVQLATQEDIRRGAADVAQQIRQFTPGRRPAFVHVSLTNWFTDMRVLAEVEKALGPDYVAVRADHLPVLMRQARARGDR